MIEARNQAEANLSALLESTSDLIWCVDLNFCLLNFNSAYRRHIEEKYGVTPILGQSLVQLLTSGNPLLWQDFYRRALAEGPFHVEYDQHDGLILDMSLNPIYIDGGLVGVSVFGKDITRLKQAETSNRFLLAAAESMADALVTSTPEGVILTWNRGAEQIFGYRADEVVGRHYTMLTLPGRAGMLMAQNAEILKNKVVFRKRSVAVRKDGSRFQASITKCPVLDADDQVIAFSTIVRDITLECEVEQTRELLAAFVQSSDDAIMTLDHERRITSWNPGAERLLGYSAEEILGQSVNGIIPADKQDDASRNHQQIIQGAPMEPLEKTTLHKDGRILNVEIRLSPLLGIDGESVGLSVNMRDIERRVHLERLIRESEEYYRGLFESLPVGLIVLQADGSISEVNQEACQILHLPREQILARGGLDPVWNAVREDGSILPQNELPALQTLATGEPIKGVVLGLGEAENRLWISMNSHPLFLADAPRPHAVVTSFIDITDKVHDARALRTLSAQYQNLLSSASDVAIIYTDLDGTIRLFNTGAEKLLGYSAHEMVGLETMASILAPVAQAQAEAPAQPAQSAQSFLTGSEQMSCQRKDGLRVDVRASVAPVYADDGHVAGLLHVVQDISEQLQVEQALRRVAQVDQLTGIPNRRYFTERIEVEFEQIQRFGGSSSVMMIDIDHFKEINDTLGHEAGDHALQQVAAILQSTIRSSDLVARLGGDEFVALISGAEQSAAMMVASKLCAEVSAAQLRLQQANLSLTISIGVATIQCDDSGWSESLRRADNALYLAKRAGRNMAMPYRP